MSKNHQNSKKSYNEIMLVSLLKFAYLLIACIDLAVLTLVMYLCTFLPASWTAKFYPPLFQYWSIVFTRALGIDLKKIQHHARPLPSQYILIANHPSAAEDIAMPALFRARFLAKAEVRHWWIVGRISVHAQTLYVQREDKQSRSQAMQELVTALNQGDTIALYPEGGCKGRRIFTPFQTGAFNLSFQTGVPIVPVFIHYEAQEAFEWQNQHLLYKLWMILNAQNGRANYHVYDAIYPTEFDSKDSFCAHVEQLYLGWQKQYLI